MGRIPVKLIMEMFLELFLGIRMMLVQLVTLGIQVQLMPMRLLVMLKIRMVKLVLLVEMPLEEIQVQLVRLLLL